MLDATKRTLLIFDFDNTLVDDNTDTRPFEHHAPEILETHLLNRELRKRASWTDLVNTSLGLLHSRGIPPSEVLKTVSEAPFPRPITQLLHRISKSDTASQAIISDANTHYIAACLAAHGLSVADFGAGVHTNRSLVTDAGIVVTPYAEAFAPHVCERCPSNMCKSCIMERILEEYGDVNVIYVGDGGNDYCPAEKLPVDALVLARKGYRLERLLNETPVKARVRFWADAEDLVRFIHTFVPALK